jgi:hypothetical protein
MARALNRRAKSGWSIFPVLASHRLGLTNANRDLSPDLASTHVVPDQCELAQVKSLDVDHDC